MAKAKKAKSNKDEPINDIPEDMANDLEEAVSAEDKPSKVMRSTKIPITHWEEESEAKPDKKASKIDVEEKAEVAEDVGVDPVIDDEEPDVEIEEGAEEEPEDDGHSWHLIEDEEIEGDDAAAAGVTTATAVKIQAEDEDEVERPDWDEETWKSNIQEEDEEEVDRPEWDEETWRQANMDEEEMERPEWDDEQWSAKPEAEDDAALAAAAAAVSAETIEEDAETTATDKEKPEQEAQKSAEILEDEAESTSSEVDQEEAETVQIAHNSDDEDEDADSLSAAQLALNQDDEDTKKKSGGGNPVARFVAGIGSWWQQAKLRNSIIAAVVVLMIIIVAVPTPRYAMLNTVGVRATASLSVIDSETKLPLKEVNVSLGDKQLLTDDSGAVVLDGVRLGTQKLTIEKSAYDTYTQDIQIRVGSNNIATVELVSVGTSFKFELSDWLTNEPIKGAEVTFESNAAFADDTGLVTLNTPDNTSDSITVVAKAPGYADKEVTINTQEEVVTEVKMVVDRYHTFVSKRDGTYDVYRIRADGSDEKRLLEGSGNERSDIRFDSSPSGKKAVLVATRDRNIKNSDGYVMSGLYLIDVLSGEFEKLDSSERIDIVGWIGETVVYVKVQAGASGRNPERHRLVTLNTGTKQLSQIAASNYFNDVLVANDYVFYAPSDAYKQNPRAFLFRSNADGSSIETVFEKTVWTILRTGYNEIIFDSEQTWYQGEVERIYNVELDARPTNFASRLYTENPSGSRAAWVDTRDGQGTLILVDTTSEKENTLVTQGGLRNPVVWLDDTHLMYRVVTSTETADYVISTQGGDAVKITNVTNVSGADRWYYYY